MHPWIFCLRVFVIDSSWFVVSLKAVFVLFLIEMNGPR